LGAGGREEGGMNAKKTRIGWRMAALAPGALLVHGLACSGLFTTRIGDILQHPRDYDGKIITVAGTAGAVTRIGPLRSFVVEDETGSIRVLTERAVPREGEQVKVRGTVQQSFAFFGESLIVIREEPAD
jgi:cytochrome c-type biogenesis protein CcmE